MGQVSSLVQERKKHIELVLAQKLLELMEKETLPYAECREIAQVMLKGIRSIKIEEDIMELLTTLSSQWPEFQDIVKTETLKKSEEQMKDAKLDEVRNKLLQFVKPS